LPGIADSRVEGAEEELPQDAIKQFFMHNRKGAAKQGAQVYRNCSGCLWVGKKSVKQQTWSLGKAEGLGLFSLKKSARGPYKCL